MTTDLRAALREAADIASRTPSTGAPVPSPRRSGAAQWAKVAPLIERLRKADASFSANDSTVDAIDALLAATEATP